MVGAASLGIDLVAADISLPETAFFLEANLTPGLRVARAAGLSAEAIGAALLGNGPSRLPSTLIVAPRVEHAGILGRAQLTPSTGWTDGRAVGMGERRLPAAVTTPHDGIDLLVRRPSLESLLVLADAADILEGGMPLDRADKIVVAEEAALPADWMDTLRRHGGTLEVRKAGSI